MNADALPPVLGVPAVMARYGLRDRRAARRIIDEAGGFHIAGRLVVRFDDLDAHECALAAARRASSHETPRSCPVGAAQEPGTRRREPLEPGWWRT